MEPCEHGEELDATDELVVAPEAGVKPGPLVKDATVIHVEWTRRSDECVAERRPEVCVRGHDVVWTGRVSVPVCERFETESGYLGRESGWSLLRRR